MQKKHPLIKKNDKVVVLTGKEKGKIGTVLKVDSEKGRVLVEKVNMVTKHERARSQQQPGGLVTQEAPIHLSKLMLVDPKTNEPTRIRWEEREGVGKVRVSKNTGNEI